MHDTLHLGEPQADAVLGYPVSALAAEEKLRRLVKAGVIGRSWLECDTPSMSDTVRQADAPPQQQPEPGHPIPRLRLL